AIRALRSPQRSPPCSGLRSRATMSRVKDAKPRRPRGVLDLQHVRHAVILLCDVLQAIPDLSALGDEVVIGIDHESCRERLFFGHVCHGLSPTTSPVTDVSTRNACPCAFLRHGSPKTRWILSPSRRDDAWR